MGDEITVGSARLLAPGRVDPGRNPRQVTRHDSTTAIRGIAECGRARNRVVRCSIPLWEDGWPLPMAVFRIAQPAVNF